MFIQALPSLLLIQVKYYVALYIVIRIYCL